MSTWVLDIAFAGEKSSTIERAWKKSFLVKIVSLKNCVSKVPDDTLTLEVEDLLFHIDKKLYLFASLLSKI
jgi:hypothetical protein